MKKPSIEISIIITSFNTKSLLMACLGSIFRSKQPTDAWEIIVVDNASTDGSADEVIKEFKEVVLVRQQTNSGFAVANNIGIRKATGTHILLLNSDTEISRDAIVQTLGYMTSHPSLGALTCRVELPDGRMDPACHRGFPTPWAAFSYFSGLERVFPHSSLFAQYHQGYKDFNKPHDVDCISGAFFLVQRCVIEEIGMLDEDYFMYGEDIDWCYRIKKAGWQIGFYPYVTILHKKKQSGRESGSPLLKYKTKQYFYNTMKLFYKKHYQKRYGWLVTQIIFLGISIISKL